MSQQVIIHSYGRSGSNILLDCFDLANNTHCRNEPHSYKTSPLRTKILNNNEIDINTCMSRHWDEVSDWMSMRWGYKDRHHPRTLPKSYYHRNFWDISLPQFLIHKNRIRQGLASVYPEFKHEEYRLPSWMLKPNWLEDTVHIFKLSTSLGLRLFWLLENRPDLKIVHLVRHPLGYTQSLSRRFLSRNQKQDLNSKNYHILKAKFQQAAQFGMSIPSLQIESLDWFDSALWRWMIGTELVYQYANHPQIITITYEQMIAHPEATIEKLFKHCELPWNAEIQQAVAYTFQDSAKLTQSFRSYWSADHHQKAEEILSYSSFRHLWSQNLWDRLHQMTQTQNQGQISYSPY